MTAFVCVVEAQLHFGESQDLKGKRKHVKSLKDAAPPPLRRRGRRDRGPRHLAADDAGLRAGRATPRSATGPTGMERFIESRCPDGCSFERDLLSLNDIRG